MTDRDPVVRLALERLVIPEHRPGFHEELWSKIAAAKTRVTAADDRHAGTVGPTGPGAEEGHAVAPNLAWVSSSRGGRPPRSGSRGRLAVVAVAAALIVVVALAVTRLGNDDAPDVVADGGTVTTPAPPGTETTGRAEAEAEAAVMAFLDALGRGDLDAAAGLIGPISEARAEAAGGLEAWLRPSTEGHGAWTRSHDRTVVSVGIEPGLVVVVLEGTLSVEGMEEHRIAAFPVRRAESAGVWFVELWAFDFTEEPPLRIVTPDVDDEERAVHPNAGSSVEVIVDTGPGTVWFSTDGGSAIALTATGAAPVTVDAPVDTELITLVFQSGPDLYATAFRLVDPGD